MKLPFSKLYAAGHDYLFPALLPQTCPSDAARRLCDRHEGLGAEGCIISGGGESGDLTVICYNAEGVRVPGTSRALSCAAKELYDTGAVNRTEFCLRHDGGTTRFRIESCGGEAWGVTRDLGYPLLDGSAISRGLSGLTRAKPMRLGEVTYPVTVIAMGETFAILHTDEHPKSVDTACLDPLFPDGFYPASVVAVERDLLSVAAVGGAPPDEERLASAAAVACAICGTCPFGQGIRVACNGGTYHVTVTPDLRTYVTCEIKRAVRGTLDYD